MPGQRRPSNATVLALLKRYRCPTPFHAVRARFMGSIASPLLSRSPVSAIQELWGGKLPAFDNMDDLNHLLDVLMNGLWNSLIVHLIETNPFKLTRLQVKPTREGLHRYAEIRKQEIEGFVEGLVGPQEELYLPESARDGLNILEETRAMLAGAIPLLDDTGLPAPPEDLKGLSEHLRALTPIIEKELNTVVLSCTRARRQGLANRAAN